MLRLEVVDNLSVGLQRLPIRCVHPRLSLEQGLVMHCLTSLYFVSVGIGTVGRLSYFRSDASGFLLGDSGSGNTLTVRL